MKVVLSKSMVIICILAAAPAVKADVLGAAAGAVIGSQFGKGNGKIAMAALGAVIGDRATTTQPQNYYGDQPRYPQGHQNSSTIIVPQVNNYIYTTPPPPQVVYIQPQSSTYQIIQSAPMGYYYRNY